MNHVTIYRDEFKSDVIFDQYMTLGFGKVSDNEEAISFVWQTRKDVCRDLAEMFEQMDSDQVFDWVQNTLRETA